MQIGALKYSYNQRSLFVLNIGVYIEIRYMVINKITIGLPLLWLLTSQYGA